MVDRSISKEKYVIAGIITLMIFLLGLFLGLVIEGKRVGYVDDLSKSQNIDFNSLQLQYIYLNQLSQERDCESVSNTLSSNINNLESTRIRLENFNRDAKLNKEEFEMLKREYIIAQLRYWLLVKQTKSICGTDIVTILYFFSDDKNCPRCGEQQFVLDHLKKQFADDLLIFALDEQYEQEPMISLLKQTYTVSEYPTLVIENAIQQGFADKDEILKIMCPYYNATREECTTTQSEE